MHATTQTLALAMGQNLVLTSLNKFRETKTVTLLLSVCIAIPNAFDASLLEEPGLSLKKQ